MRRSPREFTLGDNAPFPESGRRLPEYPERRAISHPLARVRLRPPSLGPEEEDALGLERRDEPAHHLGEEGILA